MQKLIIRNKRIFRLREKEKYSFRKIADEIGISAERVRQIVEQKGSVLCNKHKIYYIKECRYCKIKNDYIDKIDEIAKTSLMDEIARLSKPDRRKETVLQRQALIVLLKDKYGFNFHQISNLLEKDHTSITYLYNKAKNI